MERFTWNPPRLNDDAKRFGSSIQGARLVPIALTIAGSDPSGGAGIQADLKTFSALKVYGMAVITAITAQDTKEVRGVFDLAPGALAAQIDAVMSGPLPAAIKIGMLSHAENVRTVALKLAEYGVEPVVLDPVMAATSGSALLDADGCREMSNVLFPRVALVTPNLDEAEVWLKRPVRSVVQMEDAARIIHDLGAAHVLVKGGHLRGDVLVDVFFDGENMVRLSGKRIEGESVHGSGCVLSAAITAYLARGTTLLDAVKAGKAFTTRALEHRVQLPDGPGPCDPLGLSGKE